MEIEDEGTTLTYDFLSVDDGFPTPTSTLNNDTEDSIFPLILDAREQFAESYKTVDDFKEIVQSILIENEPQRDKDSIDPTLLLRKLHKHFLEPVLEGLSWKWVALDASRPWLIYWILHALSILGVIDEVLNKNDYRKRIITTLKTCIEPNTGAFGGGPGQKAHLATTYAAVNAIAILDSKEGYKIINKNLIKNWLCERKQEDGSFTMMEEGEIDVRGVYCALSICKLLGIWTSELLINVDSFIKRCQSYEGGFSGVPESEAHGGYTFCALSALFLAMSAPIRRTIISSNNYSKIDDNDIDEDDDPLEIDTDINDLDVHVNYEYLTLEQVIDIHSCTEWVMERQCRVGGGFQGRINKLIDGCYSFWQGGTMLLLETYLNSERTFVKPQSKQHQNYIPIFGRGYLQEYILVCCQDRDLGGLIDKPGKYPDYYHTCYNLSGLSCSQHIFKYLKRTNVYKSNASYDDNENDSNKNNPGKTILIEEWDFIPLTDAEQNQHINPIILGTKENLVKPVHPLLNILPKYYHNIRQHFEFIPIE